MNEVINIRWLLQEIEDPFVMLPLQSIAKSLSQSLIETEYLFNENMGMNGVARKFWSVPEELHHAQIGILIGAGFVLCQTTISQTIALYIRLRDCASDVQSLPKKKDVILSIDSKIESHSDLSEIAIIDLVANYFKHHHEWPLDWVNSEKTSFQARSINRALSLGINEEDELTDNMLLVLNRLDVSIENFVDIANKVQSWRESLARRLYPALRVTC